MSFIYGLAYALLEAYPVVFQGVYGFKGGNAGLPFIGLVIGQAFACAFVLSFQRPYIRKLEANNNVPIPEWRLPPCIVGGITFSGGLFWYDLLPFSFKNAGEWYWQSQVRLDGLHHLNPLDRPHGSRWNGRFWHHHHLHAMLQLPPRHLSSIVFSPSFILAYQLLTTVAPPPPSPPTPWCDPASVPYSHYSPHRCSRISAYNGLVLCWDVSPPF